MISYEDLLAKVGGYQQVVVTGPQRSGTTFIANCIAVDLGKFYIDEREIDIDNRKLFRLFLGEMDTVFQCPACTAYLEDIPQDGSVLIVFVHRDIDDIIRSEKRIRWADSSKEKLKYGPAEPGPVSQLKYDKWEVQKLSLPHHVDFAYDDIKGHEFFVPKEERVNFKPKQIVVGEREYHNGSH